MSKKSIVVLILLIGLGIAYFWVFIESNKQSLNSDFTEDNSDKKSKSFLNAGDLDTKGKALSINGLLDESDRTDENKLRIQNHSNILDSQIRLRGLKKNRNSSTTVNELTQALQALIYDAHIVNELKLGNDLDTDLKDLGVIQPNLIPDIDNLSRQFDKDYISDLNSKVKRLSEIKLRGLVERDVNYFATSIYDSLKRRKQQTDVFYHTFMHKYLLSKEYTVDQKVNFVRQFIDAQDWELAKDSIQFFEDGSNPGENEDERKMIKAMVNDVKNGIDEVAREN